MLAERICETLNWCEVISLTQKYWYIVCIKTCTKQTWFMVLCFIFEGTWILFEYSRSWSKLHSIWRYNYSMIQFIYIMACNMKMMYIISHCHWYPDSNKKFQEVISSSKRFIKCDRDKKPRILFMIKIGGH